MLPLDSKVEGKQDIFVSIKCVKYQLLTKVQALSKKKKMEIMVLLVS